MFSKDFKEFVSLLNKNEVEYLIVGGYAVGYHGYPRYTGDLDIWLNPSPINAVNILKSVHEFGFGSLGLKVEDFTISGNVVQLGYPPLRIDLLTEIDGVTFDECYKNKSSANIDGLSIQFIQLQDLIKNKKESGRHKDLDDIEHLRPES